jgi:hypothetical protein
MKFNIFSAILVCLLIASIVSLVIGIHSKDIFFLAIAALLIFASILIFSEIKKMKNDPFS